MCSRLGMDCLRHFNRRETHPHFNPLELFAAIKKSPNVQECCFSRLQSLRFFANELNKSSFTHLQFIALQMAIHCIGFGLPSAASFRYELLPALARSHLRLPALYSLLLPIVQHNIRSTLLPDMLSNTRQRHPSVQHCIMTHHLEPIWFIHFFRLLLF